MSVDFYTTLNDDWIKKFDKTDELYQEFYKDDLCYVHLKCIYVNKDGDIEKINQDTFIMNKPNIVSREEILQILKQTMTHNSINYSLLSILRYNITLDPDDVKHFLLNDDMNAYDKFLTTIQNIDTITFEKTINMFQDLNSLIFVFHEKSKDNQKTGNNNNNTKKIYLRSLHLKKTFKKRYKD
jgi:hypothetical protein